MSAECSGVFSRVFRYFHTRRAFFSVFNLEKFTPKRKKVVFLFKTRKMNHNQVQNHAGNNSFSTKIVTVQPNNHPNPPLVPAQQQQHQKQTPPVPPIPVRPLVSPTVNVAQKITNNNSTKKPQIANNNQQSGAATLMLVDGEESLLTSAISTASGHGASSHRTTTATTPDNATVSGFRKTRRSPSPIAADAACSSERSSRC